MNFALAGLGIGEKHGLYRDSPVSKGCTSPFAPIWIRAIRLITTKLSVNLCVAVPLVVKLRTSLGGDGYTLRVRVYGLAVTQGSTEA